MPVFILNVMDISQFCEPTDTLVSDWRVGVCVCVCVSSKAKLNTLSHAYLLRASLPISNWKIQLQTAAIPYTCWTKTQNEVDREHRTA